MIYVRSSLSSIDTHVQIELSYKIHGYSWAKTPTRGYSKLHRIKLFSDKPNSNNQKHTGERDDRKLVVTSPASLEYVARWISVWLRDRPCSLVDRSRHLLIITLLFDCSFSPVKYLPNPSLFALPYPRSHRNSHPNPRPRSHFHWHFLVG